MAYCKSCSKLSKEIKRLNMRIHKILLANRDELDAKTLLCTNLRQDVNRFRALRDDVMETLGMKAGWGPSWDTHLITLLVALRGNCHAAWGQVRKLENEQDLLPCNSCGAPLELIKDEDEGNRYYCSRCDLRHY